MEQVQKARDRERVEEEVPVAAVVRDPAPAETVCARSVERQLRTKREAPVLNKRARNAGRP